MDKDYLKYKTKQLMGMVEQSDKYDMKSKIKMCCEEIITHTEFYIKDES